MSSQFMVGRIRRMLCAPTRQAMAAMLLLAASAFGAAAQTLTNPAPPAKAPSASKAAKSPHSADAKACSGFGPGFVNVPGTDACVKIGGWVTIEGSARH